MSYQEDRFTEVADAIRAKIGGGSIQATQFASKIGLINSDDAYTVRFIDYDGTVISEQIVAPGGSVTPPTVTDKAATNLRPALTLQGWNHPQSEFDNVQCDIDAGAIYVPTDGKTHVYLRLTPATGFAIPIYLNKGDTSSMTIDWGDGTTSTSSASGNLSFTSPYNSIGLKHITISGSSYRLAHSSTTFVGAGTQSYKDTLVACYVGSGCTHIQDTSFYQNHALIAITLPNGIITSSGAHFSNCRSLKHISVPQSITSLPVSFCQIAASLSSISLPYGMTNIGATALADCNNLEIMSFPITTTTVGTTALRLAKKIQRLVIHANMLSIQDNALQGMDGLKQLIYKPSSGSVLGSWSLYSCQSLTKIVSTVPIIVKSGMFFDCKCIDDSIQVLSGATTIGGNTFSNNHNRTYFDIPSTVNSIGAQAFSNCLGLKYIIFNSTTPPALADANALFGHPTGCIYFVPDASLATYQAATNWATVANKIRPYSEFNINDFQ